MPPRFFRDRRPHEGLTWKDYVAVLAERAQTPPENEPRAAYYKINNQRTSRVIKTYSVSPRLEAAMRSLPSPQLWMVLTEPWCGDSAQCLPYIAVMADSHPDIDLRILLRDDNLDIMDLYLTDDARGIPKLIAFDLEGNELFRWGPRPRPAAELFRRQREAGTEKQQILEQLHLWYARDKGQAMEQEILELLERVPSRQSC